MNRSPDSCPVDSDIWRTVASRLPPPDNGVHTHTHTHTHTLEREDLCTNAVPTPTGRRFFLNRRVNLPGIKAAATSIHETYSVFLESFWEIPHSSDASGSYLPGAGC